MVFVMRKMEVSSGVIPASTRFMVEFVLAAVGSMISMMRLGFMAQTMLVASSSLTPGAETRMMTRRLTKARLSTMVKQTQVLRAALSIGF